MRWLQKVVVVVAAAVAVVVVRASVRGDTHVGCWAWVRTSSGVGRPGRRAPQHTSFAPGFRRSLDDDTCHDEHLHAPILRGAYVPPLEDDAYDEHLNWRIGWWWWGGSGGGGVCDGGGPNLRVEE